MTTTLYMPANHASVWKLAETWPLAWLLSPTAASPPVRGNLRLTFAVDNGMYHAPDAPPKGMKALPPFYKLLWRIRDEGWSPEWIVAPDVPYRGTESLALSLTHAEKIWRKWPDAPLALAVQDGMGFDVLDSAPWRCCFVAGSTEWKENTMKMWVEEAHRRGMLAHVARVNNYARAVMCRECGADSADGTSWGRGRRQQIEDTMRGLWPDRSERAIREAARVVAPREVRDNLWSLTERPVKAKKERGRSTKPDAGR